MNLNVSRVAIACWLMGSELAICSDSSTQRRKFVVKQLLNTSLRSRMQFGAFGSKKPFNHVTGKVVLHGQLQRQIPVLGIIRIQVAKACGH